MFCSAASRLAYSSPANTNLPAAGGVSMVGPACGVCAPRSVAAEEGATNRPSGPRWDPSPLARCESVVAADFDGGEGKGSSSGSTPGRLGIGRIGLASRTVLSASAPETGTASTADAAAAAEPGDGCAAAGALVLGAAGAVDAIS